MEACHHRSRDGSASGSLTQPDELGRRLPSVIDENEPRLPVRPVHITRPRPGIPERLHGVSDPGVPVVFELEFKLRPRPVHFYHQLVANVLVRELETVGDDRRQRQISLADPLLVAARQLDLRRPRGRRPER